MFRFSMHNPATASVLAVLLLTTLSSCNSGGSSGSTEIAATGESCMQCHNGSMHDDYAGSGLENPHPFTGAGTLKCTTCHGGNPEESSHLAAHIPPPPEIGDRDFQDNNAEAYFNRLTLTGMDRYADYEVNGVTYTALDYLQFINPGDLRVTINGDGCGSCHMAHAECVAKSPLATETGIFSGAKYAIGAENSVPASQGLYEDTAADLAFRAIEDLNYVYNPTAVGAVSQLLEFPVYSVRGANGPDDIFQNPLYDAATLGNYLNADNSVISDSPLANLFHEQVAFTCGDCHLGSAGANNRYGDFRSSGCTSCHMQYSLDGRYTGTDPQINKLEPADPDNIDDPERPHVKRHMIRSVARTLVSGETIQGIDDYACAGCHQGSNRTVMQYWGIRLDQNQDVRRGNQYPAQPVTYRNTANDPRLFDAIVDNNTFNGRNANQYLLEEDYDGDGRDDTPPDVHYAAGMGCIDCHGSHDLHGGTVGDNSTTILSRQEQAVAISCESCHGDAENYANTGPATNYDGQAVVAALDTAGNPLRHVVVEDGELFLYSRLTGNKHYVKQTKDVVVDSGKVDPLTGETIYSAAGSFAMGRADGSAATGLGPQQTGGVTAGFSHGDNLSCVACHASWTNSCIGCHLGGEYNNGNNFSNITGERIVFRQANADFVYQTPVPFQLGVDTHGKIAPMSPNTETFFQYRDRNGIDSQIFTFSDRNGHGSNPASGHPSLSHNVMMPHSIRGKVTATNEGARSCVSCHLTTSSLANFGTEYDAFRTAMATDNFGALDFELLRDHIGKNPGNQIDSPMWVHMVAGLGSGLFLFDENGCPVNPLDDNEDRVGCDGDAPADIFDVNNVFFALDKIVLANGQETGSSNHAFLDPNGVGPSLRDGALSPGLSGPLGATLIDRLTNPTTGIILDSWVDADGVPRGNGIPTLP